MWMMRCNNAGHDPHTTVCYCSLLVVQFQQDSYKKANDIDMLAKGGREKRRNIRKRREASNQILLLNINNKWTGETNRGPSACTTCLCSWAVKLKISVAIWILKIHIFLKILIRIVFCHSTRFGTIHLSHTTCPTIATFLNCAFIDVRVT